MNKEKDKRIKELYELAMYYYSKQIPVHIKLINGKYYNGIVLSVNQDFKDRFVLLDKKFGEMLFFFDRIIEGGIEPVRKGGKNE